MPNLLNTPADFQVTRTSFGTWKRYLYPSGMLYREFVSHSRVGAWPLVHIATGRNPETGKIATARGFFAIGRKAIGVVASGKRRRVRWPSVRQQSAWWRWASLP